MRKTYYWDRNSQEWALTPERAAKSGLQIMSDNVDYASPVDGRRITSRAEHREDLKRNGCRVSEPGERRDVEARRKESDKKFSCAVESTLYQLARTL